MSTLRAITSASSIRDSAVEWLVPPTGLARLRRPRSPASGRRTPPPGSSCSGRKAPLPPRRRQPTSARRPAMVNLGLPSFGPARRTAARRHALRHFTRMNGNDPPASCWWIGVELYSGLYVGPGAVGWGYDCSSLVAHRRAIRSS
jgi:hypothetical protein